MHLEPYSNTLEKYHQQQSVHKFFSVIGHLLGLINNVIHHYNCHFAYMPMPVTIDQTELAGLQFVPQNTQ